ncbi:protein chibby homolog 1-like [Tubulanus polymorphus]|uniref:protein chibby homolog 1-like n=1 Tax=Tubulanus polymorphus TaxID=672921 RepID=UPI003DA24DB6
MPLFGNKFSPKKTPVRKSPSLSNLTSDPEFIRSELALDYGPIQVKLGNNEVTFENGQWISESEGVATVHREMAKVKKQNQQLIEENNLLKLKIDILLDMLSETTAEVHLQENEIQELKSMSKNVKKR